MRISSTGKRTTSMGSHSNFIEKLSSCQSSGKLIEVDRSALDKHNLEGFVVGVSTKFLALKLVDDSMRLDGYTVVELSDIERFRHVEEKGEMIQYVLSRRYPAQTLSNHGIDLGELADYSFLKRVHQFYPLITVHREAIDNEVCYIGQLGALKLKTFTLKTIDTVAEWAEIRRFRYEDVTRVDFGRNYEEALWMYAENKHKPQAE